MSAVADLLYSTWFTSGLWPQAILGWPFTDKPDYKNISQQVCWKLDGEVVRFHSVNDVELTEIGIFYSSGFPRMIMLSLKLTGEFHSRRYTATA